MGFHQEDRLNRMKCNIVVSAFVLVMLQACAGTKNSYESLIEDKGGSSAVYLTVGETKEILSISNGFPGWWGFYPAIVSHSPEIANVTCNQERSLTPFRSPGVILGGEVCYLTANSVGETWLEYGNVHTINMNGADSQGKKIKLVVSEP
ncbi:hypothetical protein IMCC21906_02023 [Spongiibacter sp. IMCC21906]|uniref:hypothetical protein n=1 Tax=Spongiibacter sp. IMCC21906 TaxID=1620392 RepID=UPI00062DFAC0|nr:hypothetical protein [Spongiibacter sp. IMCC21906]AKH69695.1 hypothetical protein IMCC21906_02023 [Spongiibacter sp. IMCC21906]